MPKGGSGKDASKRGNLSQEQYDRLPSPIQIQDMRQASPELQGSQKQVEWAGKIRNELMSALASRVMSQTADGRPIGQQAQKELIEALQSKSAMVEYVGGHVKIREGTAMTPHLLNQEIARKTALLNEKAEQIRRLGVVAKQPEAKFWIDRRTSQAFNFQNKKLEEYVIKMTTTKF